MSIEMPESIPDEPVETTDSDQAAEVLTPAQLVLREEAAVYPTPAAANVRGIDMTDDRPVSPAVRPVDGPKQLEPGDAQQSGSSASTRVGRVIDTLSSMLVRRPEDTVEGAAQEPAAEKGDNAASEDTGSSTEIEVSGRDFPEQRRETPVDSTAQSNAGFYAGGDWGVVERVVPPKEVHFQSFELPPDVVARRLSEIEGMRQATDGGAEVAVPEGSNARAVDKPAASTVAGEAREQLAAADDTADETIATNEAQGGPEASTDKQPDEKDGLDKPEVVDPEDKDKPQEVADKEEEDTETDADPEEGVEKDTNSDTEKSSTTGEVDIPAQQSGKNTEAGSREDSTVEKPDVIEPTKIITFNVSDPVPKEDPNYKIITGHLVKDFGYEEDQTVREVSGDDATGAFQRLGEIYDSVVTKVGDWTIRTVNAVIDEDTRVAIVEAEARVINREPAKSMHFIVTGKQTGNGIFGPKQPVRLWKPASGTGGKANGIVYRREEQNRLIARGEHNVAGLLDLVFDVLRTLSLIGGSVNYQEPAKKRVAGPGMGVDVLNGWTRFAFDYNDPDPDYTVKVERAD